MVRHVAVFAALFMTISVAGLATAAETGEALFKRHCVVCHPNGGNIINPKRVLSKKAMEERDIKGSKDIVRIMRSPGPGMTRFDARAISDKDAQAIANYILKEFK